MHVRRAGEDIVEALSAEFAADPNQVDSENRAKLETLNGVHSNAAGLRRWLEKTKGDGQSHPHPH